MLKLLIDTDTLKRQRYYLRRLLLTDVPGIPVKWIEYAVNVTLHMC